MVAGWLAATLSGLGLVPAFAALYFGQPIYLIAALGVLIGGIVIGGSNRSTRQEAEAELSKINDRREALIAQLELRVVGGTNTVRTLH